MARGYGGQVSNWDKNPVTDTSLRAVAGQILSIDSTGLNRINWVDNSLPIFGPADGVRFSLLPGTVRAGHGFFANFIFYWPVNLKTSVTFDAFVCDVNTAVASSNVRMAVVKGNSSWQPESLVIQGSSIDTSTTGEKVDTVTKTTLQPGRYLLAAQSNSNPNIFGNAVVWPDFYQGAPNDNGFFHRLQRLNSASITYAAFADPPAQWASVEKSSATVCCPVVLRSAAP
jgi:hypothetical protein